MIRNKLYMSQIVDFEGMQYGRCRPTDIDLSIDFNRKVFVFVELKFKGTGLTVGQKIHLMALVDAIEAGGKKAYAILAEHETPSGESIMAGDSLPIMVYSQGRWEMATIDTLHELMQELRSNVAELGHKIEDNKTTGASA